MTEVVTGEAVVLDGVDFTVPDGSIFALLGPNGAGKTTTIHLILGLMTPTAGEIEIFGLPLMEHRSEILQQMNFASPYAQFPFRLTVMENLRIFARFYQIDDSERRIAELLELFNLAPYRPRLPPIFFFLVFAARRVGLAL